MTDVREVRISRLGSQGDGVADLPTGPLYVPFALPSETWRLDGGAGVLVAPAADRAPPRCPHYMRCGGCLAQHMPAEVYRDWKRRIVVDALAHRGITAEVAPLETVPPGSRRRATLSIGRSRSGMPVAGFHRRASNEVEPIARCAVLEPAIEALLPALRELGALLLEAGEETRATVLQTDTGLAVDLDAVRAPMKPALAARIAGWAEAARVGEVSLAGAPLIMRAAPRLSLDGIAVVPPPGAFVQAVGGVEQRMRELVVAAVGKARQVADLFCGLGTFALPLARRARIKAVDSDPKAIAALAVAARHARGLKPIETAVRDLLREPLSRKELEPFEAVVLDPPRAGARAQSEMLARSRVPTVVAVSCNPATFARDARILCDGGYRLEAVTPLDQFLFSEHVELVAVFRR
jgi:23S rRNA (uracil1939-C5)-methyltransferase